MNSPSFLPACQSFRYLLYEFLLLMLLFGYKYVNSRHYVEPDMLRSQLKEDQWGKHQATKKSGEGYKMYYKYIHK